MSFALAFWILMGLWVVFGIVSRNNPNVNLRYGGHGVFLFALFMLLGWKVFQAPLHP